jgi:hypothetical protein
MAAQRAVRRFVMVMPAGNAAHIEATVAFLQLGKRAPLDQRSEHPRDLAATRDGAPFRSTKGEAGRLRRSARDS